MAVKRIGVLLTQTIAAAALIVWSLDAFGFHSPIAAFLVNWLAISWVAIAATAVQFSFPAKYYVTQAFEQEGEVYQRHVIRLFKRVVLHARSMLEEESFQA